MVKKSNRERKRGLAAADAQTRRRVAQTGGQAISRNRQYMAEIGRKGGIAAQQSGRAHQLTNEERSTGGKVAHQRGSAHEFTSEEASRVGSMTGSRSRT